MKATIYTEIMYIDAIESNVFTLSGEKIVFDLIPQENPRLIKFQNEKEEELWFSVETILHIKIEQD